MKKNAMAHVEMECAKIYENHHVLMSNINAKIVRYINVPIMRITRKGANIRTIKYGSVPIPLDVSCSTMRLSD